MFARLALESDTEAIVDMARINAGHLKRPHVFTPDRVRAVVQRYLATANPTLWVVEDRGRCIGFAKGTISEYDYSAGIYTTLEVIFVRPEKRGSRAALLLLREFMAWSDRLGAEESTAGSDNDFKTEQTASFLERFGFDRVGFFLRRVGVQ
jgi:L-amino acid N-acyltransferase YncA